MHKKFYVRFIKSSQECFDTQAITLPKFYFALENESAAFENELARFET